MKQLTTILSLFALIAACKSPTFTYLKSVDHRLPLVEFKLDSSYKLYTRSICKDSVTNFPIDCNGSSAQRVETAYILLSRTSNQVLVINNVPNRNQKFFDTDRVFAKAIAADSVVLINAFFFKQFRFGTLAGHNKNPEMKFVSAEKRPRNFRWDCQLKDDTLKIISVADVRPDGENVRFTEPSLYLVPAFAHSKKFKLGFELPSTMTKGENRNTSARIFIHQKSKKNFITYFEFDSAIYKDNKAIRFAANRMYAFMNDE